MFTTGSKLFIGASVLALAGTIIYGATQSNSTLGTLGLSGATAALVLLTAINFWVRDGNVSSMDTAAIETSSAASAPPSTSMWPMVAGLGAALVPIGLVVGRAITWAALIIILIATVEWMVQAWSERALGDVAYNAGIRRRILHPLEMPILGALGLGLMIFSFSRIMLRLPSAGGAITFAAIAAGVLAFGGLIATRRNVAKSLVVVLCALGGLGLVGAGVASAVAGGRHVEPHEQPLYEEGTCSADTGEADADSSRAIAAKASLAAEITLEDGRLSAKVIGVNGHPDAVTLARSNPQFIQFKNLDPGKRRLVVDLGKEVIDPGTDRERTVDEIYCTQAVGEGGSQFIVVDPKRPSVASDEPYRFFVPGVDTATLEIEVP